MGVSETMGLGRYDRSEPRSARAGYQLVEPYRFVGGARIGWSNWTVPFATLSVDRDMAVVEVSRAPLGHDPVWIDKRSVTRVVRVEGVVPLSSGLMFETDSGAYDGLIFWAQSPRKVLESLRYLGWPAPDAALRVHVIVRWAALLIVLVVLMLAFTW